MKLKKDKALEIKQKYRLKYIGEKTGLSKTYICDLFNCKHGCSIETALKIINVIDNEAKVEDYFEYKYDIKDISKELENKSYNDYGNYAVINKENSLIRVYYKNEEVFRLNTKPLGIDISGNLLKGDNK